MKISIVTPSFNQAQFIERTLLSVATQDCPGVDHVVFDASSTDGTQQVLARFADRLTWTSEADRGQAHAVNKGIAATRGDVIGWLNSDDVYYPGALRAVLQFFEAHPDVDVVYGNADHIDAGDRPLEDYPTEPWNLERLAEVCYICQPATFFRRRVIERFGALDETLHYCMDYEFWLRLGKAGARFARLESKLAGSRLHEQTKTLGARVKVHAEINDMMVRTLGRVPDRWLYNYAHAAVDEHLQRDEHPTRYVVEVSCRSLLAAFKWNRAVSAEMGKQALGWIAGQLKTDSKASA